MGKGHLTRNRYITHLIMKDVEPEKKSIEVGRKEIQVDGHRAGFCDDEWHQGVKKKQADGKPDEWTNCRDKQHRPILHTHSALHLQYSSNWSGLQFGKQLNKKVHFF